MDPITGKTHYSDHGEGGGTRVVGIYTDPLVASGDVAAGGPHDSQTRFQNDLKNDNLALKASEDADGDGFGESFWKTNDGTAYLRSIHHDDGNIQYANYLNADQLTDYFNSNGFSLSSTITF